MAFSKIDKQRRLNLTIDLCDFAGFEYGKGIMFFVVGMNDSGTEFDIVQESHDKLIDSTTVIDSKGRIFISKWMTNVRQGSCFKITATKGRIHIKMIADEDS